MDSTEGTLMERVKALDPARQEPLAGPDQTDQTLQWVLTQPRESSGPVPSRSRSLRPVAAMAATAAVALGAGIVALWPSSGESAFASWVPVPLELDRAAVAASAAHCGEEITVPVGEGDPQFTSVAIDPVVAEKRGDHTFVLLEGENTYLECIVTETRGAGVEVMMIGAHGPLGDHGPEIAPSPQDSTSITVLAPGKEPWGDLDDEAGEGAVTSAYGLAGPDVEAIEVTTSDGTRAQATVDNGWWAVWFPGHHPLDPIITITTTDGQTHTADLTELWPPTP